MKYLILSGLLGLLVLVFGGVASASASNVNRNYHDSGYSKKVYSHDKHGKTYQKKSLRHDKDHYRKVSHKSYPKVTYKISYKVSYPSWGHHKDSKHWDRDYGHKWAWKNWDNKWKNYRDCDKDWDKVTWTSWQPWMYQKDCDDHHWYSWNCYERPPCHCFDGKILSYGWR